VKSIVCGNKTHLCVVERIYSSLVTVTPDVLHYSWKKNHIGLQIMLIKDI
jgi:hypothetical protein